MHEFSICKRIVEAALGELSRLRPTPNRLIKIRVVVGRLHQIVPEYLTFAYELLTRETAAESSEMEVVQAPVVVECSSCGWRGDIELPILRCDQCAALDVELIGGKELYLEQLEVELRSEETTSSGHSTEPSAPTT